MTRQFVFQYGSLKPFVLSLSKHEWRNRSPFDKLRANGYIFNKWYCILLSSFLLAAGGAATDPAAWAAAAAEPQISLSGVLDLPAGEPRQLPVKDPFRPSLGPRVADLGETPDLPALLLTAVLQGSGSAAAVVNGVILRRGDAYLDMKVLEISKNRVLFQRGAGKVTLFMQENLYNPLSLGGK